MVEKKIKIEYKKLEETLVATAYFNLNNRKEIRNTLDKLRKDIPKEYVKGSGFAIFRFITSFKEGFDIEAGFPVSKSFDSDKTKTKIIPKMEILSLIHRGQEEKLGESYRKLFTHAYEHGLVSDEFCREVYYDLNDAEGVFIEIQFVIHKWEELLGKNLQEVLGEKEKQELMQDIDELTIDSTVKERFTMIKKTLEKLLDISGEEQTYKILSDCAHIFPENQIEKLRAVYDKTKAETGDALKAIDAVIDFMGNDPGWGKRPKRVGMVIYSSKSPRDPEGYKNAKSELEKKKAYCFCPIIREHLDDSMPYKFCYCGAGWYKQQWEGAIGKPIKISIEKSLLKGDNSCKFAIHLPDDL